MKTKLTLEIEDGLSPRELELALYLLNDAFSEFMTPRSPSEVYVEKRYPHFSTDEQAKKAAQVKERLALAYKLRGATGSLKFERWVRVLAVRLREKPEPIWLLDSLEAMQSFVDGYVENIKLDFDSETQSHTHLICNEDGKSKELLPNRRLAKNGRTVDVIAGDFFVMRTDENDMAVDLTDKDIEYYTKLFDQPFA